MKDLSKLELKFTPMNGSKTFRPTYPIVLHSNKKNETILNLPEMIPWKESSVQKTWQSFGFHSMMNT